MPLNNSKTLQALISWGISVSLLVWIGSGLDWAALGSALKEIDYLVLIPMTLVMTIHYASRAWRWRYLLPNDSAIPPFRSLFDSLMIGNMASFLLPLRAGEFIRPFVLSKDTGRPFAETFSSVVIERFFDLSAVLIILAIISPSIPTMPDWANKGAIGLAILGLGIFIFMMASAFVPKQIKRLVDFSLKFLGAQLAQKIGGIIDGLMKGASVLRDPYRLIMTVIITLIVWTTVFLIFWSGLFMLPDIASPMLAWVLTVIVALAVAAPSAPGFIGVLQTGVVASFVLMNQSKEVAFGYSLVLHAHQFLFICLCGAYGLARRKISLHSVAAEQNN